jgi:ubiquitin carboxyl-terminal hydrolase 4/11/15
MKQKNNKKKSRHGINNNYKVAPTTNLISTIQEWKDEGNAAFANGQYDIAIDAYTQGLDLMMIPVSSVEDNKQKKGTVHEDIHKHIELLAQLYSNRSFCYIKIQNYNAAIADCDAVLETHQYHENCKVWYRRALARNLMAKTTANNNNGVSFSNMKTNEEIEDAERLLLLAKEDLRQCLKFAGDDTNIKNTVSTMAVKIQKSLNQIKQQQQQQSSLGGSDALRINATSTTQADGVTEMNGKRATTTTNQMATTTAPIPPEEQRHVVMQLLLGNGRHATLGEAFFVLEYEWWMNWCQYVRFYDGDDENLVTKISPGALLPDTHSKKNGAADEQDHAAKLPPPGPIDNSALLFPPSAARDNRGVFYKHWYRHYEKTDECLAVVPNLVRGHDYELIPREVYNAFRIWYGEITPPICRRVASAHEAPHRVFVSLYPLRLPRTIVLPRSCGPCGACGAPDATSRCRKCLSVYYCDRLCQESHWSHHKIRCGKDTETRHYVGLNNLGNTCFMNSALQCLIHATPLTRFFLSGRFKSDVNTSNPLGTGGNLAYSFEKVLKEIHNSSTSVSPIALKRSIARFAPRFAGCLQHDAQEFLAYLLDGLHEDLNRIRQAPYVELPDVTDGQNMSVAGAQAWEAHRRRNDSLVLDTFYGQFKSTCVCPQCNRVSVSFDAFNHLSLEIPQDATILPRSVLVIRLGGEIPVRYSLHLRRGERMADFKRALSELCGIPVARLVICEVFENEICQVYADTKPVSEINPVEFMTAYDVDPLLGSKTCFHAIANHKLWEPSPPNSQFQGQTEGFGLPFMMSFSTETTCRELWDLVWSNVERMVISSDDRNLLQIRLVTQQGQPKNVFPKNEADESGIEEKDNLDEDPDHSLSSILPQDSDETLLRFLGENAIEKFVFLHMEWTDPTELEDNPAYEESKMSPRIDEERFLQFENHISWIDADKKQREKAGGKGVTLDQCFETFTKPERLDEHNMWYCSKCKEHVRAMKTMELWKLPNILVVHLKRFEFKHALRRDKLDTLVDFPLEGLDLSSHSASRQVSEYFVHDAVPAIYDCFAVVNHFGRMGFGHYTAFARSWNEFDISSEWHLFDDSRVQRAGNGRGAVSPAAYVLFYRRRIFH